jgi:pantetheine-phosphate adenylyltransferase
MHITAVYPGTFDPITNGHIDLVMRASRIFHRVVVAVARNPGKAPFFSLAERVSLAREVFAPIDCVEVESFDGLLVDCARDKDAKVILRGLRAISDFEYEVQLAGMNRRLSSETETMFISAAQEYTFVSSSLVREIAILGADVSEFVPEPVQLALASRLAKPATSC